MDYHSKYIKYKNKYLDLKNQSGGSYEDIVSLFLLQHKESLTNTEFFSFLLNNTNTQLSEINPENVKLYLPYINKLNEYIYSKLSDESKSKQTITIFSYSIGNGIVEALFALFLKQIHNKIHNKIVNIIYFDVYNFTELLRSYGVFNNIVGFNQRLTNTIIQSQLNRLLNEDHRKIQKLSDMYKKFLDGSDIFIDLFIANNPQGYKYFKKSDIDKTPLDFRDNKINNNTNIRNAYNYIKLLSTPEQQQSIPMLWFIWGIDFNMDTIEETLKQIYISDKIFKQYNINSKFALSTLDKLNEIFEIELN
jgi:hypothetical protein